MTNTTFKIVLDFADSQCFINNWKTLSYSKNINEAHVWKRKSTVEKYLTKVKNAYPAISCFILNSNAYNFNSDIEKLINNIEDAVDTEDCDDILSANADDILIAIKEAYNFVEKHNRLDLWPKSEFDEDNPLNLDSVLFVDPALVIDCLEDIKNS